MPNDRSIAARPSHDLAIPTDVDFGVFGATEINEAEDLKTPRLSIAQPTSDAVLAGQAKPGDFFYAATGRSLGAKVRFQIIGFWMGRTYFDDRKVICRSYDLVMGDPGFEDAHGNPTTLCASCVASKWHGRTEPPACDKTYNYAVLVSTEADPNRKHLAYMALRRTDTDLAKRLNGDHVADGKPWFAYLYEASTLRQSNEKGNWFIYQATRLEGEADAETQREAHQQATQLVERIKASGIAAVIEADDATKDGEIPV